MAPCITLIFEWHVHENPDGKSVGEGRVMCTSYYPGCRLSNLRVWCEFFNEKKSKARE